MARVFEVDGYWKDDYKDFNGYLIADGDVSEHFDDDDIFFQGIGEKEISQSVELQLENGLEFVVTNWKNYEEV